MIIKDILEKAFKAGYGCGILHNSYSTEEAFEDWYKDNFDIKEKSWSVCLHGSCTRPVSPGGLFCSFHKKIKK